jgi:hypothetical protein
MVVTVPGLRFGFVRPRRPELWTGIQVTWRQLIKNMQLVAVGANPE